MPSAKDDNVGPLGVAFAIIPGVQSYDWGKTPAQGSLVGQYAEATSELAFRTETGKPYAELWMGTHATLPSRVVDPSSSSVDARHPTLSSYLARHPALIGDRIRARFNDLVDGELPFLFKILSIGKALSIQAHPDKELAARLHASKPSMYKDANHKPEMAIALRAFHGFCGFRPLRQILHFLDVVPEFAEVVKPDAGLRGSLHAALQSNTDAAETKRLLQALFANLMNADDALVKDAVSGLARRFETSMAAEDDSSLNVEVELARLVCTLNGQYPADVGVLCAFVLNVVNLTPGQAMFLRANEPHAYIAGDIVECMAASDNVVRAGLTPKARDVQVLVDMLTYDDAPAEEKRMQPQLFQESAKHSVLYDPPIDEFSVVQTTLEGEESESHRPVAGPSLLIVTQGKGKLSTSSDVERPLERAGQVFFIGANAPLTLHCSGNEPLITYRAYVEAV